MVQKTVRTELDEELIYEVFRKVLVSLMTGYCSLGTSKITERSIVSKAKISQGVLTQALASYQLRITRR